MIKAVNLTKQFGQFVAVSNISLDIPEGEVLALLGPNGAGKTTTIRMLGAILRPTQGHAHIAGYDTIKNPTDVRRAIGLLTEFPGLYLRMKGLDYLHFFGKMQGMSAEMISQRSETLLKRFQLWEARDKQLGHYSKGMKQKLTLVRAMLHDPQVLFLDEPTSAMDPHSARLVRDAIADLRREKRTIVLCTHNLAEAEQLADRIAIISRGQIIAQGTITQLKHKLLGDPLMELRLAEPLNGLIPKLHPHLNIVSNGENWIRYTAPDPAHTNPQLLTDLAQQNIPVVTLSEVSRSLEEVYLHIVGEAA
jgi:ABC-2 type transport system ATP-binding protein